jgi:hypothetical protein
VCYNIVLHGPIDNGIQKKSGCFKPTCHDPASAEHKERGGRKERNEASLMAKGMQSVSCQQSFMNSKLYHYG